MDEREITEPVALTGTDGRLNRAAVGWTRTPLITTDGIGRGRVGRGRNKRWEYWAVTTPTHIVAMTVSDLDYAARHARSGTRARQGQAPADRVEEVPGGTRLRAQGRRMRLDVTAHQPEAHECLGVVVPWSDRRFQYTVKDVVRPAEGTVRVDGKAYDVRPASRGRCPTTGVAAGPIACTGTGAQARAAPTAGRSASRSGAGGPMARDRSRTRSWSTGTSLVGPGARRLRDLGAGRRRRRVGGGRAQPLVTTRRTVQPSWSR